MTGGVLDRGPDIRFTKFDVDGTTLALVTDEENEQAWIQSTTVAAVEP